MAAHTYCSHCGSLFDDLSWPRQCQSCGQATYRNPAPVSVTLVPIGSGLLTVRRSIMPRQGELALPGGYIDWGESWQAAGAREVREETGIIIDAAAISLYDVRSAPDGTLLVFGLAAPATLPKDWQATAEASELVIITTPQTLAFPLHTAVAERWLHEHM